MEQDTAKKWYYYHSGNSNGPFSRHDLIKLLENKTIPSDVHVWREGMGAWKPANEILYQESSSSKPGYLSIETPSTIPKVYKRLKKFPVLLVILFVVLTMGIYTPGWFLSRRSALNSMQSREKLGRKFFIFAMVMYSICAVLFLASISLAEVNSSNLALSRLLYKLDISISLIVEIMIIYQGFKVRQIILDHSHSCFGFSMKFNRFLTFFFHISYLQFKINQLLSDHP